MLTKFKEQISCMRKRYPRTGGKCQQNVTENNLRK